MAKPIFLFASPASSISRALGMISSSAKRAKVFLIRSSGFGLGIPFTGRLRRVKVMPRRFRTRNNLIQTWWGRRLACHEHDRQDACPTKRTGLPVLRGVVIGTRNHPVDFSFTARVRAGRMSNTSPTIAKSAISKIGASESLLIATIYREPSIPALCWIAPEMPHAK